MHSDILFSNDPIPALLAYAFKELKPVRVVAGFRASQPVSSLCREGEAADGRDCCSFHLLGCRASFPGQGRGQVDSAVLQVLSPPPSVATQTTMHRLKCYNDFRKRRKGASVASGKHENELCEDLKS